MSNRITGHTRLYALLGTPVGHSGSPKMYNYCFETLGIDGVYVALDVDLARLPAAMAGIQAMGFAGLNITMPCKQAVMAYLDEISPEAQVMQACNVVVNQQGRWVGYNTDGVGYVEDLKAHGVDVAGKAVTVLGAGGAGTAIAVQCALSGAREVRICNRKGRSYPNAEAVAQRIREHVPGCSVQVLDLEDPAGMQHCVDSCDILANATSVGMGADTEGMPLPSGVRLRPELVVTDAVYFPRQTRLLREAAAQGCQTVNGTGMLIRQGAAALKLFCGAEMPVDAVYQLVFGQE